MLKELKGKGYKAVSKQLHKMGYALDFEDEENTLYANKTCAGVTVDRIKVLFSEKMRAQAIERW